MERRDEWLARTFVELADTLVADYDIVDFLATLSERCVELLASVEVGLVLLDRQGGLQVMASSTERTHSSAAMGTATRRRNRARSSIPGTGCSASSMS